MLQQIAHTVRALTVDAVEKANSGHPGLPLGMADVGAVLYGKLLKYDPARPDWVGRDRVVLSAGHGSMWLYSLLHLSGYDVSLDDIKLFRQLGSATPGHPEFTDTPGVETTTGPLGQGVGNAVGMALAERMLAAKFNKPGHDIVDHFTYVIASDGDLMEGVAAEASSLAGHLGLGRLIVIYDDNDVTIDGDTGLAFSEDVCKRYEAYGWHVDQVDAHDREAIEEAIIRAQSILDRPSLIAAKSRIGWGTPIEGTSAAHSDAMGAEAIAALKEKIGWPQEDFYVPDEVRSFFKERKIQLAKQADEWIERFQKWSDEFPDLRTEWDAAFSLEMPDDIASILPEFDEGEQVATRNAAGHALQKLAGQLPYLAGGSADLHPSTKTYIESSDAVSADDYSGRNIHFGVREHAMGAMLNGMQLHGGLRVFGSTFLVFADYMRPTIRLAALMRQPVVFVFTHDSIFVGEDGPTHQPIEQIESLRVIPNLDVFRPADAVEAGLAWVEALKQKDAPSVLLFTRQNVPVLPHAEAPRVDKGGYIVKKERHGKLDGVIVASGSEVSLAMEAATRLEDEGLGIRVLSVPNRERFLSQDVTYREQILPKQAPRLVVEAGVGTGWHALVGDNGALLTVERFGASAPAGDVATHVGLTADRAVQLVKSLL